MAFTPLSLDPVMLSVGYDICKEYRNLNDLCSPFTRIFYVVEGEARLHLPEKTQRLTPGNLYMIPAYTTHGYECDNNFVHYYLHVKEGQENIPLADLYKMPVEAKGCQVDLQIFQIMCEQLPSASLEISNPATYDNAGKFSDFVNRYIELPFYVKMWIKGCILVLFSRFLKKATLQDWTNDVRLRKVLNYIFVNI